MKEHILDLIIVENNKDHYEIWHDYFSKEFKLKTVNCLKNALENKNIFDNNTIFIIQIDQQKSNFNKAIQNKIIYLTDKNFIPVFLASEKQFFLKKPVSLCKIERIIYKFKKTQAEFKEEIVRIKKYILIPIDKKLYLNDKSKFIKLTEKEVKILVELKPPRRASKKHLLEKVWDYNPNIKTSTVETHIHRLRKKLHQTLNSKLTIKYEKFKYYVT